MTIVVDEFRITKLIQPATSRKTVCIKCSPSNILAALSRLMGFSSVGLFENFKFQPSFFINLPKSILSKVFKLANIS